MSRFGRVPINIAAVVLATVALVTYAMVQWVGGAFFEDRYTVTVPLAETGGLFPKQEVTVLGHGVGQIKDVVLTDTGVEVTAEIRGNERVPQHAVVQILRRSAIGEQAMNFIPVAPGWQPPQGHLVASRIDAAEGWTAISRGGRVEPKATTFPTEVPELLGEAVELLERIDAEDLGTVVHELAEAFGGRAELLKELNRDSLELNTTLVEGIPEFERLIATSGPLLEELNEHREALAGIWPDLADLSETLAAERPTLEAIIDRAPLLLREGEAFVRNTRANQHCLMADFTVLNSMIAQPENLHDLARGLEKAHFFYQDGFDVITQHDPLRPEVAWQRVNFLMFEEFAGQDYVPDRPTPQTKPGAACLSPWGLGVNAVRQPDHQPPDETAPPIDFAPLVEEAAAPPSSTDGADDDVRGAPARGSAADDRGPLPATGGGVAVVATPLLLAAAWLAGRRR